MVESRVNRKMLKITEFKNKCRVKNISEDIVKQLASYVNSLLDDEIKNSVSIHLYTKKSEALDRRTKQYKELYTKYSILKTCHRMLRSNYDFQTDELKKEVVVNDSVHV
jgi:hypothetical protein